MSDSKFSPDEILQILIGFYKCQSVFDPEVSHGEDLTMETSISYWRSICDLIEPKKLAEVYYKQFNLTTPRKELEDILSQKNNTLQVFCAYISAHAIKQKILPVSIMGKTCMTAAIYKTLINNLRARGLQTHNIRPSSEFIPLFLKNGEIFMEEVSKLAPGSLSKFEHRDNWIVRTGLAMIRWFILSIIIVSIVWHFHWWLMIMLCIGIVVTAVGKRFKPDRDIIGGYNTMRDLIMGMHLQISKTP